MGLPPTRNRSASFGRSLDVFVRRNLRFPLFEVFDRPDTNASCAQRTRSTIAPQALQLFNAPWTRECALALADDVRSGSASEDERIAEVARRTWSREPTPGEHATISRFLAESAERFRRTGAPADAAGRAALGELCRALFNSSEFVHVD